MARDGNIAASVALPAAALGRRLLEKIEWYFDASDVSKTHGARRIRFTLGALFLLYGIVLEATAIAHHEIGIAPIFIVVGALPLLMNWFGRFAYYFLPVFLGLFSYATVAELVLRLKLPVHYKPQLEIEGWLTPGPIPTVWLQQHLYHGVTGGLETFCVAMYASHFLVPFLVAFALAMVRDGKAFASLMYGLLAVSVLAMITFVLVPTAPPWLAAQDGYLPGVHHVLKQSLYDLDMTKLGDLAGDPRSYAVAAAVPSLHVAYPVICLLTARTHGLPRWAVLALAFNTLGVVFAIVYTGEHYLFDGVVGAVYALVAWRLVRRILGQLADDWQPVGVSDLAAASGGAPAVLAVSESVTQS